VVRIVNLGQKIEVTVPPLRDAGAKADIGVAPAPSGGPLSDRAAATGAKPSAAQRTAAIAIGSVGLAGVAAGGALGLLAMSTWSAAEAKCPTHTTCSKEAHDLSTKTLGLAKGSTIAFAAGGAVVAGAVVLWLTAPSSSSTPARPASLRLSPIVGAAQVGGAATMVF
jgi:hypothetical protein